MKTLLIFIGLLLSASVAAAGQMGATGRTVPTPTRNVTIFTELENSLADAVQKRDVQAIDKLVAENFELRSGTAPGVPTAREEYVKQLLQLPPLESRISQMAVHEYGDLMMVSYLWKIGVPAGSGLAQSAFVVDTWKRNGGNWQLLVRYASPLDSAALIPGAIPPSEQSLRKKI
ncbi:nuclear transport factor 2 family protein [Massilia horti]|nr:nuclear transport factor 2 family protein [Massilia horti]